MLTPPGQRNPLTPHTDERDHSAVVHTDHGTFRMLPGEQLIFTCDQNGKVTAKQVKAASAAGPSKPGGNARQAALEKVLGGLRPPKMDK